MALLSALFGGSDRDRFAAKVIARLKARGWTGPAPEYSSETYSLKLDDEHRVFLKNGFVAWARAKGAEKDRQIDVAIGFLFEPKRDGSFAEAKPYLLPALRNRADLTNLWLAPGSEQVRDAYDGAMRAFCDDLVIALVIDSETAMKFVTRQMLADWNTSFDEAFEVALGNLRAVSPCKFERDPGGYWVSDFGDHHDAARLLLPHLLEHLNVRGDPIAVVLDRTAVLAAGSEEPAALEQMAAFAEGNYGKTDRPLACTPLVFRNGAWARLGRGSEGSRALDRLRVLQALRDYTEQKALLDAHYRAINEDIFVAGLRSAAHEAGGDTWAMWMQAINTLLPRADVIALARGSGDQMESRSRFWADVEAEFGPFTPETHLYPPRYRLSDWPADAWERIEALPKPAWAKS